MSTTPPFFCQFRPIVVNLVSSSKQEKAALVRSMAERCLAGEFDGSAFKASRAPVCIRFGIDESTIRYHINQGDPAAAVARAAHRARVDAETAAAKAAGTGVQLVQDPIKNIRIV